MRVLVIVVGLLGLAWARPAVAESHEFRIATLAPSGSPWMEFLEKAGDEIGKATDGRVTVKYYPGGQQGDERDFVRKIKLGQLDGAAVTAIGLAMIDPSILVLELPMLFDSVEEVDYVGDKMWPYFQAKFEKKGFRLADRGEVAGSTSTRRTRSRRSTSCASRSCGRSRTTRSARRSSTS